VAFRELPLKASVLIQFFTSCSVVFYAETIEFVCRGKIGFAVGLDPLIVMRCWPGPDCWPLCSPGNCVRGQLISCQGSGLSRDFIRQQQKKRGRFFKLLLGKNKMANERDNLLSHFYYNQHSKKKLC